MADQNIWTPEADAELLASFGAEPEVETPPAQQAPTDPAAPEPPAEHTLEERYQHLVSKVGTLDNELAELRRQNEALRAAAQQPQQQAQQQQPDWNDPAVVDQFKDKLLRQLDPEGYALYKDADPSAFSAWKSDRAPLVNLAQLMFSAVNRINDSWEGRLARMNEASELALAGATPELVAKMTANPQLEALWQGANLEQKKALIAAFGGAAPTSGGPVQGSPARPVPDRSTFMEMAGGTGAPAPRQRNTVQAVYDALDKGNMGDALDGMEDILNESLIGVQGASVAPRRNGRTR